MMRPVRTTFAARVAVAFPLALVLSGCIGDRQTDTVQVGYRGVAL